MGSRTFGLRMVGKRMVGQWTIGPRGLLIKGPFKDLKVKRTIDQ